MKWEISAILVLTAIIAIVGLGSQQAVGETDPFIDDVLYSKDSTETKVLVQSGRDNATFYRYLILDDYSEAPENWSRSDFNDSEWIIGAAPFGDRSSGGVEPNTDWDTSGSSPYNNDIILIRHKFQVSGIVTSAEIDVAVANFCTPYINGNMIYDDRGGDSRAQEYWNDDAAGTITPSSFNQGENVLAVYARDYVGGWGSSNRQWIDLQIRAQVFEPTNEPVILGDTVTVGITGGNKGNESVNEFFINVTSNNKTIETFYYGVVPADSYGFSWLQWTPEIYGLNQLRVQVSCNCSDSNTFNNTKILELNTRIYSLESTVENGLVIMNGTRTVNIPIEVKNTGDMEDNVSLSPAESMFSNWNIEFTPNNFVLGPDQSQNVIISVVIPGTYDDGFYNLSFDVKSEHDYVITRNLVERGSTGEVDWKWINSTSDEELYSDTNWTDLNFNDTSWKDGKTPFGDEDLDGIDYKTYWDGDNYAYFRHIVEIPDIGLYDDGFMSINVATNNYGDHYINGVYVFGDIDGGDGHGAEYWNEEFQAYINYLNQGTNVIASVVYNPQNAQWFDQEIKVTFPQSNLWNYNTVTHNVPIYLDTTAPVSRVTEQGFYRNSSTFEIEWKSLSNYDDLEGYYIYYQVKNGSSLGDWTLLGYFNNNSLDFTGENGIGYRFRSIAKDSLGNLEIKGTYDTEVRIDLEKPKSILWLVEGDLQFTNLDGVTIKWKADNSSDILGYLIEYRKEGDDLWEDFGSFTSASELWFSPETDGKYEIRSRTVDFAGNQEMKVQSDVTITFDRVNPTMTLATINELTGSGELPLFIEYTSENLSQINLEMSRLTEGTEDVLVWNSIDESTLEEWSDGSLVVFNLVDGYTYYFRASPVDLAGNNNPNDPFSFTIAWNSNFSNSIVLPSLPLKPVMIGKIRNIEVTVDENRDGTYEISLEEYTGNEISAMKANQYWVDYTNGLIIFGDGTDGYLPNVNSSISITYHSYDLSTTIDLTPPSAVESPEYVIENRNNVTLSWKKPDDATNFIIENRKNVSSQWMEIDNIDAGTTEYQISNLSDGLHYYRIISVDRMGYKNINMEGEMIEIFIEAEVIAAETTENNDIAVEFYYMAAILLAVAASSAFYLLRGRKPEEQSEGPVLVPVDMGVNSESDGVTEPESDFGIVSGSEFSRQVVFICENGCQKEFTGDSDEEEIMCPHCGMIGDSPL